MVRCDFCPGREVPDIGVAGATRTGKVARVGRKGARPVLALRSERMYESAASCVPDSVRLIPAHGSEQLIVRAEARPHNGVAMALERQPDLVLRRIPDANVPRDVGVGLRPLAGEVYHRGAVVAEGLALEVIEQSAGDMGQVFGSISCVERGDGLLDVLSYRVFLLVVELPFRARILESCDDAGNGAAGERAHGAVAFARVLVLHVVEVPEYDVRFVGDPAGSRVHAAGHELMRTLGLEGKARHGRVVALEDLAEAQAVGVVDVYVMVHGDG